MNARILKTNSSLVDILVVSHAGRNGRNLNPFLSTISPQVLALFIVQYIPHVSLIGVFTYNHRYPECTCRFFLQIVTLDAYFYFNIMFLFYSILRLRGPFSKRLNLHDQKP